MKSESILMSFFRKIGKDNIAWALRRLHCPVDKSALVLEVGSGGNPYYRANVLLDAYECTRERHWVPLVADRPTVLGFVEKLPFKDKAFDFVIASHVLEHSPDPEKFLAELQRVSKAGYIETPDAFMERLNPYRDHRLEVTVREEQLVITKKDNWKVDKELAELYEHRVKHALTRYLIPRSPFDFHVRYFWSNTIKFVINNPECDSNWMPPKSERSADGFFERGIFRNWILNVSRNFLSQKTRNRNLELIELLCCPDCGAEKIKMIDAEIQCENCNSTFSISNGIPVMYPHLTQVGCSK